MSNQTPAWAIRAVMELDDKRVFKFTGNGIQAAAIIAAHAPDCEALAVALKNAEEYLRQVCIDDARIWGHKEILDALASHRAHSKQQ